MSWRYTAILPITILDLRDGHTCSVEVGEGGARNTVLDRLFIWFLLLAKGFNAATHLPHLYMDSVTPFDIESIESIASIFVQKH